MAKKENFRLKVLYPSKMGALCGIIWSDGADELSEWIHVFIG
jgi:hypothetical protein